MALVLSAFGGCFVCCVAAGAAAVGRVPRQVREHGCVPGGMRAPLPAITRVATHILLLPPIPTLPYPLP
jgi:hypothetical protein